VDLVDTNEDIEAGEPGERDERGRFLPSHQKKGGRVAGVGNWNARRVAESMGVSPLIVALTVLKTGFFPLAKGEKPEDQRRASPELFTKILLHTLNLVVPSLSAVQVTGADEGPVQVTSMSLMQIMSDPLLANAAQTLALGLVQSGDTDEQRPQPFIECGVNPKRR
jgi:hypothetical protein